jgi:GDP-mannose 6-dehydrogenase
VAADHLILRKEEQTMKISIFGLGYVGVVTAACLARQGHIVIGVDINEEKVELLRSGKSPIVEDKIGEIIAETVGDGRLVATTDARTAFLETEVTMVCVGTPSTDNDDVDLRYVIRVTENLGRLLREKNGSHTIVFRSTIPPGTTEDTIIPLLEEASGKRVGKEFDVCFNPEFLREGASVSDFYNPPFTIIGVQAEGADETVRRIFSFLDAPVEITTIRTAELVKYVCNVWHALKICFGNEIGTLARRLGVDGHEVMRLFLIDTKQNVSPMYLKPGFAYGGSCLPKDVRGLLYQARAVDYFPPLLSAIPGSNERQLEEGFRIITSRQKRKIGFLGLAFKAGTDDLRESPLVILAERLIGKGYELSIYDRYVNVARIFGSNKEYIDREIPHIEKLFAASAADVVSRSEVVVVGNRDPEYLEALELVGDHEVVDLVRVHNLSSKLGSRYHGICW